MFSRICVGFCEALGLGGLGMGVRVSGFRGYL